MKRLLCVGLICALGAGSAGATKQDAELEGLEPAWSEASQRHDVAMIDRMLASEYVGVDGRGVISNQAEELQEAMPPEPGTESIGMHIIDEAISNVRVRAYGSTAVIHADHHINALLDGSPVAIDFRRTTVWVRRDKCWQCVAFHANRFAAPTK